MPHKTDAAPVRPALKQTGMVNAARELAANVKASFAKPAISEKEALAIAERHYEELGWRPSGLSYERCLFEGKQVYRFQEVVKGMPPGVCISAADGAIVAELAPFEPSQPAKAPSEA